MANRRSHPHPEQAKSPSHVITGLVPVIPIA
jgi:hypothetical protein